MPQTLSSDHRWLWPCILCLTLLQIYTAATLGLAEDEAYYWCWAQNLDWGYFDHPPMVAYFIAAGTTLLGDTELGVRIVQILLGVPMLWMCYHIAGRSLLAVCLVGTLPIYMLGGVIATPDAPLLFMWFLGLWATHRQNWILLGVAAGLAMLSKYTGALLFPIMLIAQPQALKTPKLYLGLLLAVLIYSPNIYWNLSHDQISWQFQLHHIQGEPRRLDFFGAQFGLAGPLSFALLLAWFIKGPQTPLRNIGLMSSIPLLGIAVYAGGEANWAAPAYIGALLALSESSGRWERLAWTSVGINFFLCLLVLVHAQFPLLYHPKDPLHRLNGGQTLGESIAAWGETSVWTTRYQEAAWIRFYGRVPAFVLPEQGRLNQFEFWSSQIDDRGLFVRPFRISPHVEIEDYGYEADNFGRIVAFAQGDTVTRFHQIHAWQVYPFALTSEKSQSDKSVVE